MTPTEKLASSGLTPADAKRLGIKTLDAASTGKLFDGAPKVPALLLQYHDADGERREGIYRVRLLEPVRGAYGEEKPLRFLQKPGTPPAAYFPRLLPWGKYAADASTPLVITEGELKAACACRAGVPTIGLGGVSSWRTKKLGWEFLPELAAFTWPGRRVVVCYDSDVSTNPQVGAEAARLCRKLRDLGAVAAVTFCPPGPAGEKVGVDDFIVAHGADAFRKLVNDATADDLALALHDFNGRYTYVTEPDVIYDTETRMKVSPHRGLSSTLANLKSTKVEGEKRKVVSVAKEWLEWPQRREALRFTYRPGQPETADGELNLWHGWGAEEKRGDVKLWHELLDYLFDKANPGDREWFERWVAYPIQHPGTKLATAACIWSPAQGVGKSLAGLLVGGVYGRNFSEVPQREFESSFTSWGVERQFVLVDDVNSISNTDRRDNAARFKTLITQESFKVNIKYVANFTLPDCLNYYITSNSPDAILLDEGDRRFFVHRAPEKAKDAKWYARFTEWRESGEAASSLLYYFRRVKLGEFNKYTRPPLTEAKAAMQAAGRSDLDQWAVELRENPDKVLVFDGVAAPSDLWTPNDLYAIYERANGQYRATVNQLGNALARTGMVQRQVWTHIGARRLWAVRNVAKWAEADNKAWGKHYKEHGR